MEDAKESSCLICDESEWDSCGNELSTSVV